MKCEHCGAEYEQHEFEFNPEDVTASWWPGAEDADPDEFVVAAYCPHCKQEVAEVPCIDLINASRA